MPFSTRSQFLLLLLLLSPPPLPPLLNVVAADPFIVCVRRRCAAINSEIVAFSIYQPCLPAWLLFVAPLHRRNNKDSVNEPTAQGLHVTQIFFLSSFRFCHSLAPLFSPSRPGCGGAVVVQVAAVVVTTIVASVAVTLANIGGPKT